MLDVDVHCLGFAFRLCVCFGRVFGLYQLSFILDVLLFTPVMLPFMIYHTPIALQNQRGERPKGALCNFV